MTGKIQLTSPFFIGRMGLPKYYLSPMTKLLIFLNGDVLISKIEEVSSELGEPDCKLIDPFVVNGDKTLSPWLFDLSSQNIFMIHSDKILTISTPKASLIEKYEELTK